MPTLLESPQTQPVTDAVARASTARGYIPTLDGWRALAIGGVMLTHGMALVVGPESSHPQAGLNAFRLYGSLGVNVFFGISGLLITSRLIEQEQRTGRIGLGGFYIRRACRILPPCFFFLLVIGLLGFSNWIPLGKWEFISAATFWRNYLPDLFLPTGWYTGHFWSLAIEEHFYLLWPCILFVVGSRRAIWVAIGGALMVLAWKMIRFRLHFPDTALPHTELAMDGLLWGCIAGLSLNRPRVCEIIRKVISPAVWLVLFAAFWLVEIYSPPLKLLWRPLLIATLIAGTVLTPKSPVARILEWNILRWIGRLSYSLYLWQQLFFVGHPAQLSSQLAALQSPPVSLLGLFICAIASYYLIERPFIQLGHRLATPASPGRKDL